MVHWRDKHEQDLSAVDVRDMRATVAALEKVIAEMWTLMTVTETLELSPAALDIVVDIQERHPATRGAVPDR